MFKNLLSTGSLIRALHAALTWAVTLVLFLFETDLRRSEKRGEFLQPVSFVLLVFCSMLLYFITSLMDPGYVTFDDELKGRISQSNRGAGDEKEQMIPVVQKAHRLRRCGFCMVQQQPMRSKHCQSCQHCVRRYDHHCPWIENCVGERNHRFFVLYLMLQLAVLLWAFHIAWSGFHTETAWKDWLQVNLLLLLAFIVIIIFTVVVMLLLVSHLYLISNNTTTWEFMSRHRISYLKHCGSEENPFDQGILGNLWTVFCVCRTVVWERIYFQDEDELV
ncbi:palmitoyltransferase ZDHHC12-A isoform X1 [Stegostoma tigrinum]|uniref:palmitoyltransferase ZDHHC12-A isoform X1 n=1 Tax=Stegostoma tigrinum TaxID=3053191 RepID=UPI0028702715|nr:palmitoyltransferase ZDHHC12-A isoform X1 [Stegostoma tigrinum]